MRLIVSNTDKLVDGMRDAEVRDSNIRKYEFNEVRLIVSNTDELVDGMRDAEVRDSNTDE